MIDAEGEEWLPVEEAAARLGLPRYRLDLWASRGRIRAYRIKGRSWVNYPDAAAREHAWRTRATRGTT